MVSRQKRSKRFVQQVGHRGEAQAGVVLQLDHLTVGVAEVRQRTAEFVGARSEARAPSPPGAARPGVEQVVVGRGRTALGRPVRGP